MIFLQLINHQWKQARRSPIWQKNLAVNIIMGFFFFIVLLEFVVLSIFISDKWHEIAGTEKPFTIFHQVLAWYFSAMLVFRFFMQKLPALEVRPYQHLPVKKQTLIHYILFRGSLGIFNLLTFIILIPFSIFQVSYSYSLPTTLLWLLAMFSMDLLVNYTVFYFKKQMAVNLKPVLFFLGALVVVGVAEYMGWFSFSEIIASGFDFLLDFPLLALIIPVLAFLVYKLNYNFLLRGLYLENYQSAKAGNELRGNLQYLNKAGVLGQIISMDIKLQLRNKRTKSMLMMAPLFLAYGLFFYPQEEYSTNGGFVVFVGMFTTSVLAINYLQYAFAYEGAFFDYLRTSGLKTADIVKAKSILGSGLIIVSYILTTPYIYFGTDILLIHTACALFSVGFIVPAILFFATYNKKTMVLSRGSAFNYQGVGAAHFFAMIPVFVLPVMIYLPFKWLGNPHGGMIALGSIGVIGLLLKKWIHQMIADNLEERKYIMSEGFRQKY